MSNRRAFLKMLGIGAAGTAVAVPALVEAAKAGPSFDRPPLAKSDPFHIPQEAIPRGVWYNWKRAFVTRDDPDWENINMMIEHGWNPVPRSRHSELFPPNGSFCIETGGLVLMEKAIPRDAG